MKVCLHNISSLASVHSEDANFDNDWIPAVVANRKDAYIKVLYAQVLDFWSSLVTVS